MYLLTHVLHQVFAGVLGVQQLDILLLRLDAVQLEAPHELLLFDFSHVGLVEMVKQINAAEVGLVAQLDPEEFNLIQEIILLLQHKEDFFLVRASLEVIGVDTGLGGLGLPCCLHRYPILLYLV